MTREDEFFVGYLPMAGVLKRRMRIVVGLLAATVIGVGGIIAGAQHGFAHSAFEFGQYRSFEGTVLERPYPMLLVTRPGKSGDSVPFSTYLLVDRFKHGAAERVRGLHGKTVRLQAQLIYRDQGVMLELKPGSIQTDPHLEPFNTTIRSLGRMTLRGELIDTKCYLGVMNPGSGKLHRDCAARCVSGGVPLALVTSGSQNNGQMYLVRTASGDAVPRQLLAHAGEIVTISGEVVELGEKRILLLD